MKIVVTGGAGFIGSHLVKRLLKEGTEVTVIDNLYRGKLEKIEPHFRNKRLRYINSDIRNMDDMMQLIKGANIVFHLAAQSNVLGAVEDIDYSFSTNVTGTFNLLSAAKEAGVRRFIFTSSREVYGEALCLPVDENHPLQSKNAYGASKVAGETYCRGFAETGSFDVVVLRLANVYGKGDYNRVIPIFLEKFRNNSTVQIYGGKQLIDFISIEIVIETLLQSINNKKAVNRPVNVGSGIGTSLFHLADNIRALTNSNSAIKIIEAREAEVVKYVANTKLFKDIFNITLPENPLYFIKQMTAAG